MNKEQFISNMEDIKARRKALDKKYIENRRSDDYKLQNKALTDKSNDIRNTYIEMNKPCNIGDEVNFKSKAGTKITGIVLEFGILQDTGVYITSYKQGSNVKYISVPHSEATVLKKAENEKPV